MVCSVRIELTLSCSQNKCLSSRLRTYEKWMRGMDLNHQLCVMSATSYPLLYPAMAVGLGIAPSSTGFQAVVRSSFTNPPNGRRSRALPLSACGMTNTSH